MRRYLLALAFALAVSASFAKEANLTVVRSEASGCMSDVDDADLQPAHPVDGVDDTDLQSVHLL